MERKNSDNFIIFILQFDNFIMIVENKLSDKSREERIEIIL